MEDAIREAVVPQKGLCTAPPHKEIFTNSDPRSIERAENICGDCEVRDTCQLNLKQSDLKRGFSMVLGGQIVFISGVNLEVPAKVKFQQEIQGLREEYNYNGSIPAETLEHFQRLTQRGQFQEVKERFQSAMHLAQILKDEPEKFFTCRFIGTTLQETVTNLEREAALFSLEQLQPDERSTNQLAMIRQINRGLGRRYPSRGSFLASRVLEYGIRAGTANNYPCTDLELRQGAEFAVKYVHYLNATVLADHHPEQRLSEEPLIIARIAMAFIVDMQIFAKTGVADPRTAARHYSPKIIDELTRSFPCANKDHIRLALMRRNPHEELRKRYPSVPRLSIVRE